MKIDNRVEDIEVYAEDGSALPKTGNEATRHHISGLIAVMY
ncbi:MAG: hypothetical protein V7K67_23645 [Nostoc sp.]